MMFCSIKKGRKNLLKAAQDGNHRKVVQYLDDGADIDFQDKDGATALILAARNHHVQVVVWLADQFPPADLEKTDNQGWTALIHAAFRGFKGKYTTLLILNTGYSYQ